VNWGVGGDGEPAVDLPHVLDEDLPGVPRARAGELQRLRAGAGPPGAHGDPVDVAERVACQPRQRGIGREGAAACSFEGRHDRLGAGLAVIELRQQRPGSHGELPDVGKLRRGDGADQGDPLLLVVRQVLPPVPRLVLPRQQERRLAERAGARRILVASQGEVVGGEGQRGADRSLPDRHVAHVQLTPAIWQAISPNSDAVAAFMSYFAHTPDSRGTCPAR
jgi:hypothetical protein